MDGVLLTFILPEKFSDLLFALMFRLGYGAVGPIFVSITADIFMGDSFGLILRVCDLGGIILFPMMTFYNWPESIDDMINRTVGKVLDVFEIDNNLFSRWGQE